MGRVTVVVPCYNEAGRLRPGAFETFLERDRRVCFLFVDDGSSDDTPRVLERICNRSLGRCQLLSLPSNQGKAEAVRRGVVAALSTPAEYVGFWDADLATPLKAIRTFCRILDKYPQIVLVMGARVQLLGRTIQRTTSRHYLGRAFATVVSLLLGIRVYDTQCGAKLFRATDELRSLVAQPFVSKWVFDVEILARLARARRGTRLRQVEEIVYEFPVSEWRDIAGSKLRVGDFARAVPELARIYWTVVRRSSKRRSSSVEAETAAGEHMSSDSLVQCDEIGFARSRLEGTPKQT